MIELVFRSRTTATDFVTGFFESCKPKSALQTHLAVRITSCDILKAETLITSSAGIDAAVSLIGTGSIPIAKGQGVADLCEKMANMNLKTCPSAEDIRDYDSLDQVITKEQHLEFGRLVGVSDGKSSATA
ncbi:uncharacterized protein [Ptychodera flava]|uniref:uncharacterized protein n=1 Tax=Ptychodera flava TaxID=63121 RepID=UPI00396A5E5F